MPVILSSLVSLNSSFGKEFWGVGGKATGNTLSPGTHSHVLRQATPSTTSPQGCDQGPDR